jgi:hypothetical protein
MGWGPGLYRFDGFAIVRTVGDYEMLGRGIAMTGPLGVALLGEGRYLQELRSRTSCAFVKLIFYKRQDALIPSPVF